MEKKPRILFVDDEPNVLDALRRALRSKREEWDIVFVGAGDAALEAHAERPFDVLVTDMRMPGMGGFDLIRAFAVLKDGPVSIVLTGTADLATALEAINRTNVFRFYTKPCPTAQLVEGIAAALELCREHPGSLETAALDRLPTGVVLVDAKARVVFMNKGAAGIVAARDGLGLDGGNICRGRDVAETRELHRLIAEAAAAMEDSEGRALSISRASGRWALSVLVLPLKVGEFPEAAALLLVADPESMPTPSSETIRRLFGLSDAEARLARELALGGRLEEAAAATGLTIGSARIYLKRIFAKTGTGRQAELVRLILTTPVPG